jgi:serine protease Do
MKDSIAGSRSQWLVLMAAMLAGAGLMLETLVKAQSTYNPGDSKTSYAVQASFAQVVKRASLSTVRVRVEDNGEQRNAALGTIISSDGYILTKASEIMGLPRVLVRLAKPAGTYDAKIIGVSQSMDIALIKIEARGLTPVEFADTRPPVAPPTIRRGRAFGFGGPYGVPRPTTPVVVPKVIEPGTPPEGAIDVNVGEWVATVDAGATQGTDLPPAYVGVISTVRRKIYASQDSHILGVVPEEQSTRVASVVPRTGASAAGVKAGDVILAVDGNEVHNLDDLHRALANYENGDVATVDIQRGKERLNLRIVVGAAPEETDPEMELLSGDVSRRSTNFAAVYQHDSLLKPEDCGGPLVDLDGHVLGINIARAGRTESYAIPADLIVADIALLKSGELAPPASKPVRSQRR